MDHWPQRVSISQPVTPSKMSVTNAQGESSEHRVLLGEEGGMTRNERVEDKEMDEARQGRKRGTVRDNTNEDK